MAAKISDLQERQIINIADGKCLGNIKDIELDLTNGCIKALVLPGLSGFWNMLQNHGELVIPWEKVVRIGVDVVLIDAEELLEEKQWRGKRAIRNQESWKEEVKQYQLAIGALPAEEEKELNEIKE